jgi:hypothetical protein
MSPQMASEGALLMMERNLGGSTNYVSRNSIPKR